MCKVFYEDGVIVIKNEKHLQILPDIPKARLALDELLHYCDIGDFFQRVAIADAIRTAMAQMIQDQELKIYGENYASFTHC